ncbi:blr2283 [Bradyrhizobium diazoefficiens USDA 110]|uniref:Blr2283 protein n=1 Tax=Bradyrhizobium diazoefficiens (strain JCM 10833 / BCRC 13528 / IAM 13628 / NBRC 14792 / USDA 110) TaxID=224911 RepID=Q89SW7_BRADU|nr:hypothetical protein CO678_31000 [Bradyrhizobium diazoefficiens]QBP21113.1 hypothetical protein Bdiaspc4_11690 [Bradyrhizobium diazoefficiens]BAC47548.1 blr2283 [Bradyrhizobium diazoefficiens USDA 110]
MARDASAAPRQVADRAAAKRKSDNPLTYWWAASGSYLGIGEVISSTSPHARALATLALHHLVALLEQTFAFTVFAFLLLLDVRAFFTGHEILLPRESGLVR